MGRKNHRRRLPQAQRRQDGTAGRRMPPPPSLETMVLPRGRCPLSGKLRFAAEDADTALRQARQGREARGLAHHENRTYECKTSEGGCGDWHLTSRTYYEKRTR